MDKSFARKHNLKCIPLRKPISLKLIDGSIPKSGIITHTTTLEIKFPSGEIQKLQLFLTKLDSSCQVVLGLSWLKHYNPVIDWRNGRISFEPMETFPRHPLPIQDSNRNLLEAEHATHHLKSQSENPETTMSPKITTTMLNPVNPLETTMSPKITTTALNPETNPAASIQIPASAQILRAAKIETSQTYMVLLRNISNENPGNAIARSAISQVTTPSKIPNVPDIYGEFADVFDKQQAEVLPQHGNYDHAIPLEEGTIPPMGPIYSLSETELKILREYIQDNLSKGFIQSSRSPAGAPILFVKKKDGTLRLCVDYRGLNKITRKNRYPLPLISNLLDRLRTANYFSKIDLRGAYNLVRIAPGDEWKTAFRTRYGSYEYQVMPFGLCNAPATFQQFMNEVFADLLDINVIIYLDDILIFSENLEIHQEHIREVLRRLRKNNLFAKPEKCEFHKKRIEFLGYVISSNGIYMDQEKIQVIQDWPEPQKVRDIQSFLGFANFYRRFIPSYSQIVLPLTRLTRKNTAWNFDERCKEAFQYLKKAFISAPTLIHWNPNFKPILETDASDHAIASIFSMETPEGEIQWLPKLSQCFSNFD
jgi:hypothetical protein